MGARRGYAASRAATGLLGVAATVLALTAAGAAPAQATGRTGAADPVTVIVRPASTVAAARTAVERLHGAVGRPLALVGGFTATLPADRVDDLARDTGIAAVTRDGTLRLHADKWKADKDLGSSVMTTASIGAQDVWRQRDAYGQPVTGKGIGVALIDSGIAPVEGLDAPGKVINGPDLSFESQAPNLRHLDTFGHGTHLAGIIAGRDSGVRPGKEDGKKDFVGVAPDATVVSVKVASADGAADVSQVIAAIDWVVQHRDDSGTPIRVLSLSFGTDSTQSYQLDPLAYAVEVAWRRGIVVVVSAGNEGADGTRLTMPAMDPYVLAVGASDHNGTVEGDDDAVGSFSSVGGPDRRPDLLAPGRSIVSLRAPGSYLDETYPTARVADRDDAQRFFRGSGTSQAAAVTSGAVALLLDQRPELTPDQVKYVLTGHARKLADPNPAQGAGVLDLAGILEAVAPADHRQTHPPATGTGSLEASRGGSHVADPETGVELVGEQDIFGTPWDAGGWSEAAGEVRSWSGGDWLGRTWSGAGWAGVSWAGRTWSAAAWTGRTWSGRTWSGRTWSASVWTGRTWSGRTWSGRTWSGRTWSGRTWSGDGWP